MKSVYPDVISKHPNDPRGEIPKVPSLDFEVAEITVKVNNPLRGTVVNSDAVRGFIERHRGSEHLLRVEHAETSREVDGPYNTVVRATFEGHVDWSDLHGIAAHAHECLLLGYFPGSDPSRAEEMLNSARQHFDDKSNL